MDSCPAPTTTPSDGPDTEDSGFDATVMVDWWEAVQTDDRMRVRHLMAQHPGLLQTTSNGDTPLILAAMCGWTRNVTELLPGSDPNARNGKGQTALMLAGSQGYSRVVEVLAPVTDLEIEGREGETALSWAAQRHQLGSVKVLLDVGANARHPGQMGRSALMWACFAPHPGSVDLVQLLLPVSDPHHQDLSGKTALMLAAGDNTVAVVRTLLPVSDPDATDHEGMTALMHAAAMNRSEAVRALAPRSNALHRDLMGRLAEDCTTSDAIARDLRGRRIQAEQRVLKVAWTDAAPREGLATGPGRAGRPRL